MLSKLKSISQYLRFPAICPLCLHTDNQQFSGICTFCHELLIALPPGCPICLQKQADGTETLCQMCIQRRPAFDKVLCAYVFEEPLRTLIHQFKYHNALYLRYYFSQLMLSSLTIKPEELGCLVPVPLHPVRLRHRGFNQAAVLTKMLAQHLNIPYYLEACIKIKNTLPQANLSQHERQINLKEVFQVGAISAPIITLVDDLLTTGSTAHELANIIKKHHVCKVQVWCLARAT